MSWSARITQRDYEVLQRHLHQPDREEHAAFLYAGEMPTLDGTRLLIRCVIPIEAKDFGPSNLGAYRQVSSRATTRAAIECEAEGLRLMWAHSHPCARDRVGFSPDDLATHARAHPHLIDMTGGRAVASMVMGQRSMAGEVWTPGGGVARLQHLDVVGARMGRLASAPVSREWKAPDRFARQVLMFGPDGQRKLRAMTVGVVGAGGGGSLLVQALAHLGVGRIIVIDFDRVEITNLSRIVGATPRDARRRGLKVDVARRLVKSIDPSIEVIASSGDVTTAGDAQILLAADFIFSATDTQFARYAVNAICHQYLIPGAQVGAKVVAGADGGLDLAYAMYRPIDLSGACLECGGAIDGDALRREQLGEQERRAQDYVGVLQGPEDDVVDPSVITLNSVSVALAMLDFQFTVTGAFEPGTRLRQRIYHAPERELREREGRPRPGCRWCDRHAPSGAFGRGADQPLPLSRPRPCAARGRWWRSWK